jgi:hypothetical protein
MLKPMSQSNFDYGFPVAAFVIVVYDWGEHKSTEELPISYKYFQHLYSDKRYGDAINGAPISLRMIIGRIGLGEQALMSEEHT